MLNKILNRLARKQAPPKPPIEELLHRLQAVRNVSTILALCPESTGGNWLGIKQGTISLFPESYLCLPQYYSNTVYNTNELFALAKGIGQLNFSHIVFRGFPLYFAEFISQIKQVSPSTKLLVLYAGPASEFGNPTQQEMLQAIIRLAVNGIIHKVGFNKKGLAEAFADLYGINTGRYILKAVVPKMVDANAKNLQHPQIGVFGGNTFNKNLHTQVIAGLTVPGSTVHALSGTSFDYLQSNRIVNHQGPMAHPQFLKLISGMAVNYYLSFSESWGNVVTESLAAGVPCLVTATGGIFDFDEELHEHLVVADYDNIAAIKQQTLKLFANYDRITPRGITYVTRLNKIADDMLMQLLD
jgi:hypothetical protein